MRIKYSMALGSFVSRDLLSGSGWLIKIKMAILKNHGWRWKINKVESSRLFLDAAYSMATVYFLVGWWWEEWLV